MHTLGLRLAWRIAAREMRTGLAGFRVFLACLALGVGAIATVGSLSTAVETGLMADARTLLGGDVALVMEHQDLSAEQRTYLKSTTRRLSSAVEMKAMAQTDDARTLVELKAVDRLYPMVGALTLDPPAADRGTVQAQLEQIDGLWGAVVEAGLLTKLKLSIGDTVRVGKARFQLRAVILKEPDRVASILNFGPRMMVSTAALPATGLVQRGSQIRYSERLQLPLDVTAELYIKQLKLHFPQANWRVRGPTNAAPGLQHFIDRLTLFLTFAGLTALLVGGIGVLGAVRSYLDTKTATIATFKCLGAPGTLVFQVYLLQVSALSLVGIAIGVLIGAALPFIGVELIKDQLPVVPKVALYPVALLKAAVFGGVVALTFALWPLAQARETPAANLFRTAVLPVTTQPKARYILAVLLGILGLAVLVVFWAEERAFAYWFVAVSIATVFLLHLSALAVMKIARHAPRPRRAVVRLALTNLHRPGSSTPGVVQALGVGLSVLVAVALIQGNLTKQIKDTIPDQAPAFFFIDIQPDQVAKFDRVLGAVNGATDLMRRPSLRGRIVKIAGVAVGKVDIKSGVRWAVNGDRALSYAATAPQGTVFAAGSWWPEDYSGPPLISLDSAVADGFGVGLGDTLTLNILGREITAKIASLRKINWRSLRFDFAIIFAPGTLEQAPQTHIAAIKVPVTSEAEVERVVADNFTNISAIRVREALEAANRIIAGIGAAITATASVTVLAGIIVLGGTIAAARAGRVFDAVVFKVLGATRRQVMGAFLLEYGLLGLFTGLIGATIGTLISWAVVQFIMGMAWVFLPFDVTITVIAAIALTMAAGFIGTWRALGEKTSSHLRND